MSFFSSLIVKVLQYQTLLTLRGPERQCRLDSLTGELGFQIPVVSGYTGFLELYSGFQCPGFWIPQLKFPGLRILQANISQISESGFF